jgi:hypothetical protein
VQLPEFAAAGIRFDAGRHRIDVMTPTSRKSPVATWLAARGPSPYAAALTAMSRPRTLDERKAGARIRLV